MPQTLTSLQQACDLYVIDHMCRAEDGTWICNGRGDAAPDGACYYDLVASMERVKAGLTPSRERVAAAYAENTPTESLVTPPTYTDATQPELEPQLIDTVLSWGLVGALVLVVVACLYFAWAVWH